MHSTRHAALAFLVLLAWISPAARAASSQAPSRVIYVDDSATGANNGASCSIAPRADLDRDRMHGIPIPSGAGLRYKR